LQVFKEAMRLYPPVAAVLRVARRDTELDGYFIRKGTVVMLSQYILHRRPDVFPDPERFDPLRFAPERELQLPRYAYLPFGTGHRTCIGSHLALVEGQLVLATLAQHVRFELVDMRPAVPEFVITLRPRGGVAVRVRRRSVPVDSSRRGSAPRPAP
jgi:cytochrome P450